MPADYVIFEDAVHMDLGLWTSLREVDCEETKMDFLDSQLTVHHHTGFYDVPVHYVIFEDAIQMELVLGTKR